MNKYIFLTYTLYSYTGAPSYIRNKKIWLENQGWQVIAFDVNRDYGKLEEVSFDELKEFQNNRVEEFEFHASWLSAIRREKVLSRIIKKIQPRKEDKVVIESNTERMAEWGELLAERLNAKHLIYLLGEGAILRDKESFNYFDFKHRNNELFSLSSQGFKMLFSQFREVNDDNLSYWNAMSVIPPQNVEIKGKPIMKPVDYTICYFGRYKSFYNYMLDEVATLAQKNPQKTFNFISFGHVDPKLDNCFETYNNLNFYQIGEQYPIPKEIFNISDVVIATAGCAKISFNMGSMTIAMNAKSNRPLGVLGYTTKQHIYSSVEFPDSKDDLSIILSNILIDAKYTDMSPIYELNSANHGLKYQLSCVNDDKEYYKNILSITGPLTIQRILMIFFLKLGFVHSVTNIKYWLFNTYIRKNIND